MKCGGYTPEPVTENDRSKMLQGVRNAVLLALPFWFGLIYWLTR
jgi:hypothetical protein